MKTAELIRKLTRLILVLGVALAISMVGQSVQRVGAADCVDYACDSDEECNKVDCDLCFTHDRCADLPN